MKKLLKNTLSVIIAVVLTLIFSVSAFALDSSVTYNGHDKGFEFSPGSEYSETDLFDAFKYCMPGAVYTETITVTNSSRDSDYVKIYIRAIPHDEINNPLMPSVADSGETVASMEDFLSKLSMNVYNGTDLIFEGSPNEVNGMADNVLLGTFPEGESTVLTVKLSIPASLGNEYALSVGEVDWRFIAESFDNELPSVDDDLIQTGSLEYAVPLISVLGAVLILIGIFLLRKKSDKNRNMEIVEG